MTFYSLNSHVDEPLLLMIHFSLLLFVTGSHHRLKITSHHHLDQEQLLICHLLPPLDSRGRLITFTCLVCLQ